ncbi:MAG: HlyD family efflux transporter periplasmic adaptor subunit, partial [Thiomargarita sp.]|nr:HlyD family efflux transporter periplasmic adaptor subunit [Thiomargarita sp.]
LEKEARNADSITAFNFIAVNETHRLFPYDQAVFFTISPAVKITAVSGVSTIDNNAPFMRWLHNLLKYHLQQVEKTRKIALIEPVNVPKFIQDDWQKWTQGNILWCPFIHKQTGNIEAGLLLLRKKNWREAEITLLNYLIDAYSHTWASLQKSYLRKPKKSWQRWLFRIFIIIGIIASTQISVRESVLAPAEIVAQSPLIITAPMEGTIKSIYVQPNQVVALGDKLFNLDDTVQKNRYMIAQKTLAIAQADLLRAEQKGFFDLESRGEIALLKAKVEERKAELEYVAALLKRLVVHAEQAGIAVFTDANDWLGKPVNVGEKIMFLADPKLTEIQLWVPVADAINLEADAVTELFLNTDPTNPLAAKLYQASYEADLTPDNWLAFRAKARFISQDNLPRIGLKGTGKIYGKEVNLYYYLLRRPLATIRRTLGL